MMRRVMVPFRIKLNRAHFPRYRLAETTLLLATARRPPEDIGGPWGDQEFREALADPTHERHAERVEWWGSEDYDPDKANFANFNAQ
ncbi:hypothetical protein GGE12_004479 [Rhizobium mongolense]|uniref:Plasmid pRiA4b Orf3-like domain-containing protein n=2 Tax=Rhizobium mongolense TaxID=57676 RepID=A0A7W6WFN2_9HYPH|nr:hypothetical protein [Rhizobium mongolense]